MRFLADSCPPPQNLASSRFTRFPGLNAFVLTLVTALGVLSNGIVHAAEPASAWVDTESASVRLISAVEATGSIDPDQKPHSLNLGLEFQLAKDWKIYWRSPGDAGYPPQPDWSASENVSDVQIAWPAPVRFSILGLETLGYKDEVVFPLSVTPEVPGKPLRLAGKIDYLICSDICVPETMQLALELPAGDSTPSSYAHLINKYSVRVPGDGKGHGLSIDSLSLNMDNPAKPVLIVSASSMMGLSFDRPDAFFEGPEGMGYGNPTVTLGDGGSTAQLDVPVVLPFGMTGDPNDLLQSASYVVTLVDGERSAEKSLALTHTASAAPTQSETSSSAFLTILGLAFLGGLILNLMPCVLPVLSIKLLGVISHGGSEARTVRLSFLASAAGIIVSFLVIAGALATLKSAGATIGWGIQFQQPWFLAGMVLVVIVFACNMWGWFEVHLPSYVTDAGVQISHTRGMGGHFLTGMLATLLATPCSAPFLGTAVGFALARETVDILMIFVVLGLGLSAPYLLVAVFPKLATRLPKPGAWMVSLRRLLGVALAGTAGWLLWVMSQQVGWNATLVSALFTLGIIAVIYLLHRRQSRLNTAGAVIGIAFGVAAVAVPVVAGNPEWRVSFGIDGQTIAASSSSLDALWQPFDRNNIDSMVAEGKVVFIDVTADWCITCQVNKSFVLAGDPVLAQLKSENIIAMQADWTLPSDQISDYLASYARYGIPFNAVYGPGTPEGIVLPELLSSDAVIQALSKASGS